MGPDKVTAFGWLFGLEGTEQEVRGDDVVIRPMTQSERERILRASHDFFASDQRIWTNLLKQFPFVFEKVVSAGTPIGGYEPFETVLSLLSTGEVRCPIQWHIQPNQGGGSGDSAVIEYMFRLINGRFQTTILDDTLPQVKESLVRLRAVLTSCPDFAVLDTVSIDRMFAVKRNVLRDELPGAFIARAADICTCLEYLFHEGSASEIQFRLALSMAWILEESAEDRDALMGAVKKTYALRSKHVHGARWDDRSVREADRSAVHTADRLLRRALLAKLSARLTDESWLKIIKDVRLGTRCGIDRIDWLKE